jgi:predicted transposase/invertase (TIGR01784 family)
VKTDTLFYRLFQDRPALVFELAGLSVPAGADYRWRAEEVKETAFRLDGLLISESDADAPLVFVEVQFHPDGDFYARWFSEIFLYLYRRAVAVQWRAVVLFPSRGADSGAVVPFAPLLESPWIRRVYLDELLAEAHAPGPGLELIRLILSKPSESAVRARALLQSAGDQRGWILDWAETILVYKLPQLSREEIKMILELQDAELKRSRFYQEVLAEGREEGREEGRRHEASSLVLRLLRRRLGSVDRRAEARIVDLSVDRLESLAEDLLGFEQPSDLDRWLDRARSRGDGD